MATWIYEARTTDGRVVRGTRDATDRRSALEALRSEGFFVSRLEARGAQTGATPLRPRANPLDADIAAPLSQGAVAASFSTAATPAVAAGAAPAAREARPLKPKFALGEDEIAPNATLQAAAAPQTARPAKPTFDPDLTSHAPPRVAPSVPAAPLRPAGQAISAPLSKQPYLRASNQDLSNFFRQLAALMHAGTGIGAALNTLAEHGGGKGLRTACAQMAQRAMTGEPFSQSMKSYPGLFTPLMVGITGAGERGGFLEAAFTRLADYSERDYKLDQSIKQETWYPKTIVFFSFAIGAFPTLFLAGLGPFLREVWPPYAIIALLLLAIKGWKFVKPALVSGAVEPLRVGAVSPAKIYDEIKLVLPIVGKTSRALASAKFCRALAALYSAGIAPGEAVRLGAQACGNRVVADRALKTIPDLQNGRSLTECMKETRVFNPLALQMMRVGEESGDLDGQLDKAADFLEGNAETTIKQAVPILGILLFLCVALFVLLKMIGFYTNYFDSMFDEASKV